MMMRSALSAISWREQVTYDDEVRFALDQHALLDFYSARALKQLFAGRPVDRHGTISLILSQQVFVPTRSCCVLSREATHTTIFSLWFNLTGTRTYDSPQSRRA
jgi:hypothetical protein